MSNTQKLTVSDRVARPLRTAPQGGLAWAITEGIDAFLWDMDDRQYGVLVVLLTMTVSFIQSTVENGLGKAFLRKVETPPVETPVIDNEGGVNE